jgi:hypothetical protein
MPPSPIPNHAVRFQLSGPQIVSQWFRLRMLQPRVIVLNVLCFALGIFFLISDRRQVLTWALLAFPVLFSFFFYRKLQQIVKQHPEMTAPRWMSFDSGGVVFGSATSRNEYAWDRIRRFSENKEYYYLYLNDLV